MNYRALLDSHVDFRRLWTGQVVSEVGDWLNNIAVFTLTLEIAGPGREGFAMAVAAIARHVPLFVFGPIAGVVVDRIDRRRVMIVADLLRAVAALGFIYAQVRHSLVAIYAVSIFLFSVSAFFNVAKRAAIPNLVTGADALLSANSLSSSTTAATIAVGSALGGLAATFIGRNWVFAINAATFIVSAELVRRIATRLQRRADVAAASNQNADRESERRRRRYAAAVRGVFTDFRDGLSYVRGVDVLFAVFVVAAGWGLGNGVARSLYAIFGARLGVDAVTGIVANPRDFGNSVLYCAMGVGGVIGAPLARRLNVVTTSKLGSRMGSSMVLDGVSLSVFTLMPSLWTASAVLVFRELNYTIWKTAQMTIMMSRTDDRFGGRVFASYETLTTLTMVGSMLAAGLAADRFGIIPVAAAGGMVIAASGMTWFLLRRGGKS